MLPTPCDPKEEARWRIGVLDAERNLSPRRTPWLGVPDWEAPILERRYREGYEYMRRIMFGWAERA